MDAGTIEGALVMRDMATAVIAKVEASLKQFQTSAQGASKSVGDAGDSMGTKLAAGLEKAGASAEKAGKSLMLGLTLPLGGAALGAIKLGMDFEQSMMQVQTLAGISADKVKDMSAALLNMVPETGQGPDALAKALMVVTSTGRESGEALEIVKLAAQASAVGMGETAGVARALTSILTAYGDTGLTAADAMNKLFIAVRVGAAEASELAPVIGRVVGTAAQLGVTFDEVGAFIATYTRLGVDASEATTALGAVLSSMLDPTSEAANALASIGMSADDLRAAIKEKGLQAALMDLQDRVGGNSTAMAQLFGNVRALRGILGNTGAQAVAYADAVKAMSAETDAFTKAVEATSKTNAFAWSVIKAQIEATTTVIGGLLMPAVSALMGVFTKFIPYIQSAAHAFGALPVGIQAAAGGLVAFAVALGPALYGIGKMMSMSSDAIETAQKLSKSYIGTAVGLAALNVQSAARNAMAAVSIAMSQAEAAAMSKLGLTSAATAVSKLSEAAATTLSGLASRASALFHALLTAATTAVGGSAIATTVSLWAQSTATVAVGVASRAAAAGVVMLGAAILLIKAAVFIGAIVAMVAAVKQFSDACFKLRNAFASGGLKGMWNVLTEKDENNFVRRALGMGNAAQELADKIKNATKSMHEEVGGENLAVKIGAIEGSLAKLKEAGGGTPEQMKRLGAEIQVLINAGEKLPPNLVAIAEAQKAATVPAKLLTQQLADAKAKVAGLDQAILNEIQAGDAMKLNTQQIVDQLNTQHKGLGITTAAVDLYKESLTATTPAAKEAKKGVQELQDKIAEFSGQTAQAEIDRLVTAIATVGGAASLTGPQLEAALASLTTYATGVKDKGGVVSESVTRTAADVSAAMAKLADTAPLRAAEEAWAKVKAVGVDKADVETLNAAADAANKFLDAAARKGQEAGAAWEEQRKHVDELRDAIAKLDMAKALDAPLEAMRKAQAEMKAVGDITKASKSMLEGWASALEAGMDAAIAQGEAVTEEQYKALAVVKERIAALDKVLTAEQRIAKAQEFSIAYATKLRDIDKEIAAINKQTADSAAIRSLPEAYREAGRMALEYRDRLKEVQSGSMMVLDLVKSFGPEARVVFQSMGINIGALVPVFEQKSTEMKEAVTNSFREMLVAAKVSTEEIERIFKALKLDIPAPKVPKAEGKDWSKMGAELAGTVVGALQGGGDVGKSLGASIGGMVTEGIGKKVGEGASKMLSGALGKGVGTALGGVLGSVVPVLGTMLGGAVGGWLGGLFGGGESKKTKQMRDDFIATAGGLEKLKEQADYAGVSLDKLMATKKTKDFEKEVKKLEAAIAATQERLKKLGEDLGAVMTEGGIIGASLWERLMKDADKAEVKKALSDVFSVSVDKAAEGFNKIASNFMALTTLSSSAIKEVNDEIARAAEEGGVAKLSGDFIGSISGMLEKIEPLAGAAFGAMVAKGMSAVEAIQAISPGLDEIQRILTATGTAATGSIGQLLGFRAVIDQHKELFEVLQGVDDMLTGLANSGLITQESFASLASLVTDAFGTLTMQGVGAADAITLMQPQLQKVWELQQQYGLAVDDTTQGLLDQAMAQGAVGEQFMSATDRMALGVERMVTGITALLEGMGIKVPEAMKSLETTGTAAFGRIADKAKEAAKDVGGVGDAATEKAAPGLAAAEKAANDLQEATRLAAEGTTAGFATAEGAIAAMNEELAAAQVAAEEVSVAGEDAAETVGDAFVDAEAKVKDAEMALWAAQLAALEVGLAAGLVGEDAVAGFATAEEAILALKKQMQLAAEETGDAVRKAVPTELRVGIRFDVDDVPDVTTTALPALASGGIVRRPTRALVGEAGSEAVIPLDRLENWIDRASSPTIVQVEGGGESTIILEMDGRTIARAVVPLIPGEVKRYGL